MRDLQVLPVTHKEDKCRLWNAKPSNISPILEEKEKLLLSHLTNKEQNVLCIVNKIIDRMRSTEIL